MYAGHVVTSRLHPIHGNFLLQKITYLKELAGFRGDWGEYLGGDCESMLKLCSDSQLSLVEKALPEEALPNLA